MQARTCAGLPPYAHRMPKTQNTRTDLDWRWSGCSKEQEEAEARRRATGAAKFRAVALEMDLWDLGSCSDAGSSGDDAVDEEDY